MKTELVCRNNYAKNSVNRFLVGCIVYRQFTMSFAFELTSGQWGRSTENWTSAFSEFNQHLFRQIVTDSLSTVLFHRVPLLFGTRTKSFVPQEMSLNIDMNRILPENFSGVSPNLQSKLLTLSLSCNVLNPGTMFHSNSSAHRRFCQSFCSLEKISSILIFGPMLRKIQDFKGSSQDTRQNPKRRRPSCVED